MTSDTVNSTCDFKSSSLPSNLLRKGIRRWKENREIKKAEEAAASKTAKDAADAAAVGQGTDLGGGWTQTNTGGGGATFTGGGGQTHQGWSNTPEGYGAAAASEGSFKKGGRIGYRDGEFVEEDVNIEGPGFEENIEMAEADPFDLRIQELMKKHNMSYDDAYDIAEMEFQDLFAEGSEQDQGIASLV